MTIDFICECGKRYRIDEALAGRRVKCKACGKALHVPSPGFAPPGVEPKDKLPPEDQPVSRDALGDMMVNTSTFASNEARTRLDIVHYLKCHPKTAIIGVVAVMLGLAGGIMVHQGVFVLAAAGVWLVAQEVLTQRSKLITGDVCPASVVSDSPWRIAVYTNMTTGKGQKPTILIKPYSLGGMTGGPPKVGQRIATVALYYGDLQADAWMSFDPVVLACATTNEAAIERVTRSITANEWAELDRQLFRIKDKKPGLYKLWISVNDSLAGGWKGLALKALVAVVLCGIIAAYSIHYVKQQRDIERPDQLPILATPVPPVRTNPTIARTTATLPSAPRIVPTTIPVIPPTTKPGPRLPEKQPETLFDFGEPPATGEPKPATP